MKYKLTAIERSVGVFLLVCFVGMFFLGAGVLTKNLFWKDKVSFNLNLSSAGQLQEGSKVQLKGMTIGNVVNVTLNNQAEIIARFEVSREYYKFFTTNSQIQIINPMVIGEKVVELKYVPGPMMYPVGSFLPVVESEDLINKLSSIDFKDIAPILANLKSTLKKTDMIVGKVNGQLPKVFAKTDKISNEAMQAIQGTNKLIADLQETTPLIKTAAKEMPEVSDKSVKAINEAIVVLRAMQKSFFLKGNAEEVKKEIAAEEEKKAEGARLPASVK